MPPSLAVTVTLDVPKAVGVRMVTVAGPEWLGSATEVAVTVTVAGFGTVAGAVYRPVFASIEPPPDADQVAAVFVALLTVAVNGCWVLSAGHALPASLAYKLTVAGLTLTATAGIVIVAVAAVPLVGVAVTVALVGVVPVLGAVYRPPELSCPAPVSDQVTLTLELNC